MHPWGIGLPGQMGTFAEWLLTEVLREPTYRATFTPLRSRPSPGLAMLESSTSPDPGPPSSAWEELVFLRVSYGTVQVHSLDLAVREAEEHSGCFQVITFPFHC